MKSKEVGVLVTAVADVFKRILDGPKIGGRFNELERRVAVLERTPNMKYCGIWKVGETHVPGDTVTYSNGLWICLAETPGEPNRDFVGWRLVLRAGR
jgi:hypothetical protein